jgi:hypothetical protein
MRRGKQRSTKYWMGLASVLIAGVSLLWAIFSHFIRGAEPPPTLVVKAADTAITNVSANGPGSVGYMNGGTVNNIVTPSDNRNLAPAQRSQP